MSKRKPVLPALARRVSWLETMSYAPIDERAELRAAEAVIREAQSLRCDPPPGTTHDPKCPLCVALWRLDRVTGRDGR